MHVLLYHITNRLSQNPNRLKIQTGIRCVCQSTALSREGSTRGMDKEQMMSLYASNYTCLVYITMNSQNRTASIPPHPVPFLSAPTAVTGLKRYLSVHLTPLAGGLERGDVDLPAQGSEKLLMTFSSLLFLGRG